jgi:hypothetical protein
VTSRTPESPRPPLIPTPGTAGQGAFDVAATLRRIEAVLATLDSARVEAAKEAAADAQTAAVVVAMPRKRISFDWG